MSNELAPTKFRKLIPGRCHYCGRQFFSNKHTGRPQRFCDKKCRQGEFRRSRYLTLKNDETDAKNQINPNACKAVFSDRPLPFNVLGGYRWPNRIAVDRKLLSAIIRTEIGGAAAS